MTTRGFTEKDFETVAVIVDRAVNIAKEVDSQADGKKSVKQFLQILGEGEGFPKLLELRKEVREFAGRFNLPWVQG